ncbi:MAG: hypothetical protein M3167_13650 [Acidobacteriota bacterium]|nr:hypothetical protein [Acidobacteriota bacterium]
MILTASSGLKTVLQEVALALTKAGIRAVFTGGSCATLHSGGVYQSEDLDFILKVTPTVAQLDAAMSSIGFQRKSNLYEHSDVRFFVEFPSGPLGIGRDLQIKPVRERVGRASVLMLSATDSCRDRLAHYFFWKDRQALETAVAIALRKRVGLSRIRAWCVAEGALSEFEDFSKELKRRRRARRR